MARPSQRAPWAGRGRTAAALGHAYIGQRVEHPVARPSQPAHGRDRGGLLRLRGTHLRVEGWAPCRAPKSSGAMAGTGADCCGSGARIRGAEGGEPCGAPQSTSAMAGTGADCCSLGARIQGAQGWAPCGAALSAGDMAGTGADCCGSGACIRGAEGGAPCRAPQSTGAMAGTGADCCGSTARIGGAQGGVPLSPGAMARAWAACGASGVHHGGDGGGAVAFCFGFAPYLVLASHFGAIWKSAPCVRDARCTLAEELEI